MLTTHYGVSVWFDHCRLENRCRSTRYRTVCRVWVVASCMRCAWRHQVVRILRIVVLTFFFAPVINIRINLVQRLMHQAHPSVPCLPRVGTRMKNFLIISYRYGTPWNATSPLHSQSLQRPLLRWHGKKYFFFSQSPFPLLVFHFL